MSKKLFIASSREGLEYATALKQLLINHFTYFNLNVTCILWSDRGVFRNGESTLASLEYLADEMYACGNPQKMGYAVFVLTPDEKVTMRGKEYYIARDNVIFEYGLFLGKLGHARTFVLVPPTNLGNGLPDFHMLTDLSGITTKWYKSFTQNANSTQAQDALESVAFSIFQDISEIENQNAPIPNSHVQPSNPPKTQQFTSKLTSY